MLCYFLNTTIESDASEIGAFSDMIRYIPYNLTPNFKNLLWRRLVFIRCQKFERLPCWYGGWQEVKKIYQDKRFSNGMLFISRFHENQAINVPNVHVRILNKGWTGRYMQFASSDRRRDHTSSFGTIKLSTTGKHVKFIFNSLMDHNSP
jgi:hypothetical protein